MSTIVLNTKNYLSAGIANAISAFTERSAGIAAGFSNATFSLRMNSQDKIRGTVKLDLPVVAEEATSCACPGQVLRVADANISIRMDQGMTTAERTDFALRLKDLVASSAFQDYVINLQLPV